MDEYDLQLAQDNARWNEFDQSVGTRATTLAELRVKLEPAQWALVDRECDVQAAAMIASCISDLGLPQD